MNFINILSKYKKVDMGGYYKNKSTGLFNKAFHLNWLKNKLEDEFSIIFDEKNTDYLI